MFTDKGDSSTLFKKWYHIYFFIMKNKIGRKTNEKLKYAHYIFKGESQDKTWSFQWTTVNTSKYYFENSTDTGDPGSRAAVTCSYHIIFESHFLWVSFFIMSTNSAGILAWTKTGAPNYTSNHCTCHLQKFS